MDKTSTLVDLLIERIDTGLYPLGEAVPSERQLVEELGLSRTTVRRAIDDLVHKGRLQRQPGRGTFVSGPRLAGIRDIQVQNVVAVLVPTFSNPYYGEMVNGIEKEARRLGLRLMVSQSDYSVDTEARVLEQSASDPTICGALVVPDSTERGSSGMQKFLHGGKPAVYIGRWPKDVACDGVRIDYRMAAQQAVEHLIEFGHQRIAYIEGLPILPGFSPVDGYHDVLRARRLPIKPELVRIYDQPSEATGRQAVLDLVAEGVEFSAVFARNDITAMGVLQGLRDAGLRTPQDVSVISIANSLWARSMDPPLTSVNSHPFSVGQVALRLLKDRLDNAYEGPPIKAVLDPDLIIRASTARR
ncbi:GntR family transcriptional regulator [Devosia sp. YIM 151766]|uniref:GntR family transcriptional regulator n=1 Tax=Devosia sp. YIM 151766 TaxID=3017325 RepID=UPI00255C9C97|nr:GntR family transcriptional regulator [Devosia sp. YIM 151766]WIY53708.1 GntR family transcriptional regulator [Devosia sp. YIM 151766]